MTTKGYLEARIKALEQLTGAWQPEHTEKALDTYSFEDYFEQVKSAFVFVSELDNSLRGDVYEAKGQESCESAALRKRLDKFLPVIEKAAKNLLGFAGSVQYFEYTDRNVTKEDIASLVKTIEVALHPETFPYQDKAIANGIIAGEEDVKRGRTKEDA